MGRHCGDCGVWCDRYDFSLNQWQKASGASRCKNCIAGGCAAPAATTGYSTVTYQCSVCYHGFESQNNLDQHMQVHRPRNVACPVCGEVRFRSGTNAVQHVETGFCKGCPGRDNARQQIYNFASSQPAMNVRMNLVPMLTNGGGGGGGSYGDVPDYPYKCPSCVKSFRHLSQLMQHEDAKHSSAPLLGYY